MPTTIADKSRTLTLSATTTPARDLPMGLIAEVADVLDFHGLHVPAVHLLTGLAEMIRRTPICQGGRLREDRTVDES